MSDKTEAPTQKSFSLDWLVRGVLAKIGETFDRLTGRNWKPSSSLATSELIDRLKKLLDAEAKDLNEKGKFVPHNIKLKMQWDKFSTDAGDSLQKLENELLTAAIDHINDRRYHTFAPMKLEIAPDYFTEGVKLLTSFDEFSNGEREAAVNVSVPDLKNVIIAPVEEIKVEPEKEIYAAEFVARDKLKKVELAFAQRERLSVGRTKENDLCIDDASVSKIHAALVLNSDRQLMVADTGSTNGTFINNQRIAYGKAVPIKEGDKLKFGTVEVALKHSVEAAVAEPISDSENTRLSNIPVGNNEFEMSRKILAEENNTTEAAYAVKKEMLNDAQKEENFTPTEQRIVLDLGENK